MDERPYTQQNTQRPMTVSKNVMMRPPSAAFALRNAVTLGTPSRPTTAMMQQPVNRIGTAMTLAGAQVWYLLYIALSDTVS